MKNGDNLIDLRKVTKAGTDKWSTLPALSNKGNLTWEEAAPDLLKAAIAAATEDGAALLLSKTSDGGALCIQLLHGTSRSKLYPSSADELKEALQLIYQMAVS